MGTKAGVGLDEHVADQIAELDEALARVDEVFGNLNAIDYHDITKNMTSLDKAKYDLTNMYAINSLFWMYLRSFGEDPKNTSIKEELDRIKKQMLRLSQIASKSKMPRIDKDAANRFVRHGLSKSGSKSVATPHKKAQAVGLTEASQGDDWDDEEAMETDAKNKQIAAEAKANSRKRKRDDEDEHGEVSSEDSSSES